MNIADRCAAKTQRWGLPCARRATVTAVEDSRGRPVRMCTQHARIERWRRAALAKMRQQAAVEREVFASGKGAER